MYMKTVIHVLTCRAVVLLIKPIFFSDVVVVLRRRGCLSSLLLLRVDNAVEKMPSWRLEWSGTSTFSLP